MTEADGMVFVVDDDPAMRRSLGSLLRSGGLCVEVFAWAQDLLRSIPTNPPGSLVLMCGSRA
jgi:FixJ family two-component response regulator